MRLTLIACLIGVAWLAPFASATVPTCVATACITILHTDAGPGDCSSEPYAHSSSRHVLVSFEENGVAWVDNGCGGSANETNTYRYSYLDVGAGAGPVGTTMGWYSSAESSPGQTSSACNVAIVFNTPKCPLGIPPPILP